MKKILLLAFLVLVAWHSKAQVEGVLMNTKNEKKLKHTAEVDTIAPKVEIEDDSRMPLNMVRPIPKIINTTPADSVVFRIDPPSWWVGMKNPNLQLMVHGKNIQKWVPKVNHKGITLVSVDKPENTNYLFLNLKFEENAIGGDMTIQFFSGSKLEKTVYYSLFERMNSNMSHIPVDESDFIYLIMPDRFSNGDTRNDSFKDMLQKGIDRKKMFYRHGGDLKGIMNHLDYLVELGVTTIWLNPVQENNQPYESYHGYAITDYYNIDKRFGTIGNYMEFVNTCHQKGIKVVMDYVHNHCGNNNYFITDLPEKDWIHQFPTFTRTTYRDQPLYDPYAAESDKRSMLDGWFDVTMPDLNQKNKHLANYLTQNTLWWTELAGLNGYRLDTYAYNDPEYMKEWSTAIQNEYPGLTIFGETWVNGIVNQAHFTGDNNIKFDTETELPAVTDFQLYFGIKEALNKPQGWTEGVMQLYQTLTGDILYNNPYKNVIFLGNHDLPRFYTAVGENFAKYKSGVAWLMTCRGIPQFYYGDEVLMKGNTDPDGKVRKDFSGGWEEDGPIKFYDFGRYGLEKEAHAYVKAMANYRKTHKVLQTGKLKQFIPVDGIYTYFRYNDTATVMIVMNTNDKKSNLDTKRFEESTKTYKTGTELYYKTLWKQNDPIALEPYETKVYELKK
jgi:neopullulanase